MAVSAGQQLALALTSGAYGYDYYWDGDLNGMGWPTGTYSGGQAFDRGVAAARAPGDPTSRYQWGYMYFTDGSSSAGGALADLGFRTFLTPIPEPATATFFLLGGLASVAMHRCRRAR